MRIIPQNFPARYWHQLESGIMQCDLCPQECKLKEGQCGKCGVRKNQDGKMMTIYGKVSGLAVDPIEKKPLYHFLPGSRILSFGTVGCNLSCKFCQNWDISAANNPDRLNGLDPTAIAVMAQQKLCPSVAFTYNEPTIFIEYAIDVAIACRKLGINTIAVTNGYINEAPCQEFFSHLNAANVDLKAFTENFYKNIVGASLQPVLDTLIYLKQHTKVWFEITYLLIPGENDSVQEIDAATKWIVVNLGQDVPVHFSAFYPTWKMLDKPVTPPATVIRAREIARNNGLYYVYTGNIYDPEGSNTYCHQCKRCVIMRDNYVITNYYLNATGHCKFCQAKCSGIF